MHPKCTCSEKVNQTIKQVDNIVNDFKANKSYNYDYRPYIYNRDSIGPNYYTNMNNRIKQRNYLNNRYSQNLNGNKVYNQQYNLGCCCNLCRQKNQPCYQDYKRQLKTQYPHYIQNDQFRSNGNQYTNKKGNNQVEYIQKRQIKNRHLNCAKNSTYQIPKKKSFSYLPTNKTYRSKTPTKQSFKLQNNGLYKTPTKQFKKNPEKSSNKKTIKDESKNLNKTFQTMNKNWERTPQKNNRKISNHQRTQSNRNIKRQKQFSQLNINRKLCQQIGICCLHSHVLGECNPKKQAKGRSRQKSGERTKRDNEKSSFVSCCPQCNYHHRPNKGIQ